ncbi:MAG: EamA family transporter [Chloroflexota bacterium]
MKATLLPLAFVGAYAFLLGIASFLEKPALKSLNALQLNLATGIGVLLVGIIAISLRDPKFPGLEPSLAGVGIGILIGAGSVFYFVGLQKLPVSVAVTVANAYILVTVALSLFFLHDRLTVIKGLGILATVVGVSLLSVG